MTLVFLDTETTSLRHDRGREPVVSGLPLHLPKEAEVLVWLQTWLAAGRYEARLQIRLMHLSGRCGPKPCGCRAVLKALSKLR